MEKLDSHIQKKETGPYLIPYIKSTKNRSVLKLRHESLKLLEENIWGKLLDTGLGNDFFGFGMKIKGNKSKNKQVGLHQNKKLLHSKENHQQDEKAVYGMGEHICGPNI